MTKLVTGLHHVTALASDPQRNVDFYAGVLGLRLVKRTINFDAPEVYHLYYGNESGSPGTIITFFPYPGLPKGRKGKGQLTVISFSVAEKALDYWVKRLDQFKIKHTGPQQHFEGEIVIDFEDHDGLGLELVFNQTDERHGFSNGNVPTEFAIKGLFGVTLSEECTEKTVGLLTAHMDHLLVKEKGNRLRYSASGQAGGIVDVLCTPDALLGLMGAGTVHHVAFATANQSTQLEARDNLIKSGLNVTPVIDRQYFHSIYFREPGGILFEIATIPPGFTVDEDQAHLGETLQLPPWQEPNRKIIEKELLPIRLNLQRFMD